MIVRGERCRSRGSLRRRQGARPGTRKGRESLDPGLRNAVRAPCDARRSGGLCSKVPRFRLLACSPTADSLAHTAGQRWRPVALRGGGQRLELATTAERGRSSSRECPLLAKADQASASTPAPVITVAAGAIAAGPMLAPAGMPAVSRSSRLPSSRAASGGRRRRRSHSPDDSRSRRGRCGCGLSRGTRSRRHWCCWRLRDSGAERHRC
jgi:hypothetical protein